MKIAVLSFGNLVNNSKGLVSGKWNFNGPTLPVELVRITQKGTLALAVNQKHGVSNRAAFATSKQTDLNKAILAFMKAERIGDGRVGVIDLKNQVVSERASAFPQISKNIAAWAKKNKFDAVIVNLLGQKFKDEIGTRWSIEAARNYVRGLNGNTRKLMAQYLNNIPKSIKTPLIDILSADFTPKTKAKPVMAKRIVKK